MNPSRYIVLFTRSPEDEARAKKLPLERGARLFWSLLASWKNAAEDAGARLLVIAPERAVEALARGLGSPAIVEDPRAGGAPDERVPDPPVVGVEAQRGESFGERLADAAARAFEHGARSVLLAGGDSPALRVEILRQTFSALESGSAHLVLAPAEDGGVNLIGLGRPMPDLLSTIVPGSSSVERRLASAAAAAGLEVVRLPSGRDLDGAADVACAWRLSFFEPIWQPFRALLRAVLDGNPFTIITDAPRHDPVASCSRFSRAPPPS